MKPQDEFAVIVAGVVTASTFQLLNPAGLVVAELGTGTSGGQDFTRLQFRHLDSIAGDSEIRWTQEDPLFPGIESVQLTGPAAAGDAADPPGLFLTRGPLGSGGSQARLTSGARSTKAASELRLNADTIGQGGTASLSAVNRVSMSIGAGDVFDSDAWPPLGLNVQNQLGGYVQGASTQILTGQRIGRTFVGNIFLQLGAGFVLGPVGGGLVFTGYPLPAGGTTRVLGSSGFAFQNATGNARSDLLLWNNGIAYFTGLGAYVRPNQPWAWAVGDFISIPLSYEIA